MNQNMGLQFVTVPVSRTWDIDGEARRKETGRKAKTYVDV
jgi:hypothetical protein